MGATSPVSEIPLLSKTAKFPFLTMDYSPWSSKNLIDWNRLKKFMQVRIDELCMCTNFGGHDLSGFGDTATLKNGQISLSDQGSYYRIGPKILQVNSFFYINVFNLLMCCIFSDTRIVLFLFTARNTQYNIIKIIFISITSS